MSGKHLAQTTSFKTKLNTPLPAPFLPSSQLVKGEKDRFPHRNSASTSTSCPTIHSSLFLSSGIKGHLLEALATPGLGSLTASNPHIKFAFQNFLHRAPTIRIPTAARGESLDVSLLKGGWRRPPMTGGVWLTPVLQDLKSNHCLLKGRREREKYHPPPHIHTRTHELYTPTTSNTSSDPTFQMGLSPTSFKLLPGVASLHLNSLHTSWIFRPLHSVLLTSETCFSGHQHLLIPNQPTSFHRLTFSFALSRSVLP